MDSREKIIPCHHIAASTAEGQWLIIAGRFDPLTADSARYISEFARRYPDRKVLAGVLESPVANLPAEARAVLVAALRHVHSVAVIEDVARLPSGPNIMVVSDPDTDNRRSLDFVRMVMGSQKAGS